MARVRVATLATAINLAAGARTLKRRSTQSRNSKGVEEELVWADEFNDCPNGLPDPANWGYELGYARNHEHQWYQEENAKCVDGNLVITARREDRDMEGWRGYTSSSLTSTGKQQFSYGRYEFRAKIPIELGSWPAWWLVGEPIEAWPIAGEIDMMEFYRGRVLANFAYGTGRGYEAKWDSKKKRVDSAWAADFHTWGFEWTEEECVITLDGEVLNTFNNSVADWTDHPNPYKGGNPNDWMMIINLAIGGSNGGDPSGTTFPMEYLIDYVRYWKPVKRVVEELVWADEFNDCPNGLPDPAKWGYELGYARNHEHQWYQEENAKCVDGNLVITARREDRDMEGWRGYTSSSLTSTGKQQFSYGRYEFRARIPIELGSWPAWWLVGEPIEAWPLAGEVDMMEFYRGRVLANFAYGTGRGYQAKWDSKKKRVDSAWAADFHTWGFDWTEEECVITLDGEVLNTFNTSVADWTDHPNPYKGGNPNDWMMIINLAIGGSNGGDPSNTTFPMEYLVDYVRYWKRVEK